MGRQINVIVQLNPPSDVTMEATAEAASALPGFIQDPEFGVLSVPAAVIGFEAGIGAEAAAAEEEILITRGVIDENDLAQFQASVEASPQTRAIFSDPFIEPFLTCIGTPAVGSAADVETLLAVPSLAQAGMTGKNVAVAVVDTGINLQFLKTRVPGVKTDAGRSKAFGAPVTPFAAAKGHGTMCAFDVTIGAPAATLIDIPLLRPVVLRTLLSDAILAFRHLLDLIQKQNLFATYDALVVNNSWGVFDPSTDIPAGSYTANPNHPFNLITGTLARAGADIVFAAGNCGPQCPDGRCALPIATTGTIYGANSSPDVTCVAGVDIHKQRVGYSSKGPGKLSAQKPDLAGYTHFAGSGVSSIDSGTSAAAPVVAGFFAAVRSKFPAASMSSAQFRQMMIAGLDHQGSSAHNVETGFGIVDGAKLLAHIQGGAQPQPVTPPVVAPPQGSRRDDKITGDVPK